MYLNSRFVKYQWIKLSFCKTTHPPLPKLTLTLLTWVQGHGFTQKPKLTGLKCLDTKAKDITVLSTVLFTLATN